MILIVLIKIIICLIILIFDRTKVAGKKKRILWCSKKPIKIRDVDVDNISKLIETKNNSKYLIGYLEEVIKSLVLVLPKMSGHIKTFKEKMKNECLCV